MEGNDLPAVLVGDFNAISSTTEKWGGSQTLSTQNRAFRAWVSLAGLIDMGHNGPAYTWTNKKGGSENISERLDRVLADLDWTMENQDAKVFHLPRFSSDHLPIMLKLEANKRKPPRKFRFENWWMLDEGFQVVCEGLAGMEQRSWEALGEAFKRGVRGWLKTRKSPHNTLRGIEAEMMALHNLPPDQVMRERENELQIRHMNCLLMEEQYWYQRARVQWALFGDQNSRFFHATAVTRNKRNYITALLDEQERWITEETEI